MRLVVVSHKPCWRSAASPSGYATDGGFPMQMRALSELVDATTVVVPCDDAGARAGEMPLTGNHLTVVPLRPPAGRGLRRKLLLPLWIVRALPVLARELRRADAVHAPIPGDVGTVGLLLALAMRKPLFVRHCGNWSVRVTAAERFWGWLLERAAGGRTVVLTTGGAPEPPSSRNPELRWIFSTSVTSAELQRYGTPRTAPHADGPRLVITCRQEEKKGTGVVVRALPLLRERFPGIRLDVVGDGVDLERFRRLAAELGVADRVSFHGRVDHVGVVALLRRADVFCFPTAASEGFPKVVLEAMACGLPVVTTPVSVLPQLLAGGGGILIQRAAPAEVADAVRTCLATDAAYARLSAAAVATAGSYSLEAWRDTIGGHLSERWGPLRRHA